MKTIDYGVVRLQYEMFGETAETLATEYDTTPRMIEYAIKKEGWKPLAVAKAASDWTGLEQVEKVSEELLAEVNHRMEIMRTLKRSALGSRYIALEAAILGKGLELLQSLDASDSSSAASLKIVSEVLKSLRDSNGEGVKKADDADKGVLNVNILNHVSPDTGQGEATTVQVN